MAGYSILKYLEEHQNRIDQLGADRLARRLGWWGPSIPQMPKPNAGPNISAIRTVDSGPGARRWRTPDSCGFRPACRQPHPRAGSGTRAATIPTFHPRSPGSSPGAMTGGVCVVSAMDAINSHRAVIRCSILRGSASTSSRGACRPGCTAATPNPSIKCRRLPARGHRHHARRSIGHHRIGARQDR